MNIESKMKDQRRKARALAKRAKKQQRRMDKKATTQTDSPQKV